MVVLLVNRPVATFCSEVVLSRRDDVTLKVCRHEIQQNSFSESLGSKFSLFVSLFVSHSLYHLIFFMSGIRTYLFSTALCGNGQCVTCFADLERMGSTDTPTVRPACVLSERNTRNFRCYVSILWLRPADLECNNSRRWGSVSRVMHRCKESLPASTSARHRSAWVFLVTSVRCWAERTKVTSLLSSAPSSLKPGWAP